MVSKTINSAPLRYFLMTVLIFLLYHFFIKYKIWTIGAKGEEKVAKHLERLENDHIIINDLNLPQLYGNVDHVVIGNNGIFVIETKNLNGTITCNGDDWTREKVGRMGTVYPAHIGNPSKQVKRNAAIMKKWIELNCQSIESVWVNCILTFTNEDAEVIVNGETVEILECHHIPHYIKNFKTNKELNGKQIAEICNCLK